MSTGSHILDKIVSQMQDLGEVEFASTRELSDLNNFSNLADTSIQGEVARSQFEGAEEEEQFPEELESSILRSKENLMNFIKQLKTNPNRIGIYGPKVAIAAMAEKPNLSELLDRDLLGRVLGMVKSEAISMAREKADFEALTDRDPIRQFVLRLNSSRFVNALSKSMHAKLTRERVFDIAGYEENRMKVTEELEGLSEEDKEISSSILKSFLKAFKERKKRSFTIF